MPRDKSSLCQAWYFAAMKKLIAGDRAAAVQDLNQCLATEQKNSLTYILADAQLRKQL